MSYKEFIIKIAKILFDEDYLIIDNHLMKYILKELRRIKEN